MDGELSFMVATVPPTRLRNRLVPNGMPVNCGVRGTGSQPSLIDFFQPVFGCVAGASLRKEKLASRRDFLVFRLHKIMLNFSGKVDSQFFCSLQPAQYQAFAQKLMENFLKSSTSFPE